MRREGASCAWDCRPGSEQFGVDAAGNVQRENRGETHRTSRRLHRRRSLDRPTMRLVHRRSNRHSRLQAPAEAQAEAQAEKGTHQGEGIAEKQTARSLVKGCLIPIQQFEQ